MLLLMLSCLHGSDVLGIYCIVSDATLRKVIIIEADQNIVLSANHIIYI